MARPRTTSLGMQLAEFGDARSGYAAAKRSNYRRQRTGLAVGGSGADYHYATGNDYWRIVEDSRDMDRNDAVIGQCIDRACNNTTMDGLKVDPQTPDKGLNEALSLRWINWAKDAEQCDLAGEHTFADQEWLNLRHMLLDGDVFCLPHIDGGLETIENHRCRTPRNTTKNVVLGVLKDRATNRRLEYWFTKAEVSVQQSIKQVNEVTPYKARDAAGHRQVFHIYNPKRVSQTRGVGALAPCFDTCGMLEDIHFATMVKAQVAACFAIFRERDLNYRSDDSGSAQQTGSVSYETQDDGTSRKLEGLGPGMIIRGNPGERLQGFAPNVPNAEFFPHVKLMLTMIGINLGLPLFMVLMDCSESNFSAWRGAFEEAKKGFKRNQRALISRFHTPVYKWKVRQWAAEDPAIRAAIERLGEEAFWHRWNPPRWPYIEPLKDAQAALLERRNALTSPRRQHAERGEEFVDVRDEIIDDNATTIVAAKTRAQAINKQFPDDVPVTWRDLYPAPPADGGTFQADAAQAEAAAGAEAGGKPKPKSTK